MKQWEYSIIDINPAVDKHIMQHFGKEGWELVSVYRETDELDTCYFKRPLLQSKEEE